MTQITECYVMLNCLHRNDANHRKRRTIYIITPFWRKNDMNHQIWGYAKPFTSWHHFGEKMTRITEYNVMLIRLHYDTILEKKWHESQNMMLCQTVYVITPFWRKNDTNYRIWCYAKLLTSERYFGEKMTRITENYVMLYRLHHDTILQEKMTRITESTTMSVKIPTHETMEKSA